MRKVHPVEATASLVRWKETGEAGWKRASEQVSRSRVRLSREHTLQCQSMMVLGEAFVARHL